MTAKVIYVTSYRLIKERGSQTARMLKKRGGIEPKKKQTSLDDAKNKKNKKREHERTKQETIIPYAQSPHCSAYKMV